MKLLDIPFATPADGHSVLFTTLWDNYPTSADIPLSGNASHIYLLMAGSTNHMQWGMENVRLTVRYADGSADTIPLVNPVNWAPIEQDFYTDKGAFAQPAGAQLPYRVHLRSARCRAILARNSTSKAPMTATFREARRYYSTCPSTAPVSSRTSDWKQSRRMLWPV